MCDSDDSDSDSGPEDQSPQIRSPNKKSSGGNNGGNNDESVCSCPTTLYHSTSQSNATCQIAWNKDKQPPIDAQNSGNDRQLLDSDYYNGSHCLPMPVMMDSDGSRYLNDGNKSPNRLPVSPRFPHALDG